MKWIKVTIVVVVVLCGWTSVGKAGWVISHPKYKPLNEQHEQQRQDKDKYKQIVDNKSEHSSFGIFNNQVEGHMFSVLDHIPNKLHHLYNMLGLKIETVNKKSKQWDEMKNHILKEGLYYDHAVDTLHVLENDEFLMEHHEKTLNKMGQIWAEKMLVSDIKGGIAYFTHFLNKLQMEANQMQTNKEENDCVMTATQYLGIQFVIDRKTPFTEKELLQYESEIKKMIGIGFQCYYSHEHVRTIIERLSPVFADYMRNLSVQGLQEKGVDLDEGIKQKIDAEKIQQNNSFYERSTQGYASPFKLKLESYRASQVSGIDPIGNKMLKEYQGNFKEMKNTYESLKNREESSTFRTSQVRELQNAIQEIEEINEWIYRPLHKTKKQQKVFTYFTEKEWGYVTDQLESTDRENFFSVGNFPDLRIADTIQTLNEKPIKMEIDVPEGMFLAPLGDGKVMFPTDCAVELKKGTEVQFEEKKISSQPNTTSVTLKCNLISGQRFEQVLRIHTKKLIDHILNPALTKKGIKSSIIDNIQEYIHFDFTGMSAVRCLKMLEKSLKNWLVNDRLLPKFYDKFFQTFERNDRNQQKGIFFTNTVPVIGTLFTTTKSILGNSNRINIFLDFKEQPQYKQKNSQDVLNMLHKATAYVAYRELFIPEMPDLNYKIEKYYSDLYKTNTNVLVSAYEKAEYFMYLFQHLYLQEISLHNMKQILEVYKKNEKMISLIKSEMADQSYVHIPKQFHPVVPFASYKWSTP